MNCLYFGKSDKGEREEQGMGRRRGEGGGEGEKDRREMMGR